MLLVEEVIEEVARGLEKFYDKKELEDPKRSRFVLGSRNGAENSAHVVSFLKFPMTLAQSTSLQKDEGKFLSSFASFLLSNFKGKIVGFQNVSKSPVAIKIINQSSIKPILDACSLKGYRGCLFLEMKDDKTGEVITFAKLVKTPFSTGKLWDKGELRDRFGWSYANKNSDKYAVGLKPSNILGPILGKPVSTEKVIEVALESIQDPSMKNMVAQAFDIVVGKKKDRYIYSEKPVDSTTQIVLEQNLGEVLCPMALVNIDSGGIPIHNFESVEGHIFKSLKINSFADFGIFFPSASNERLVDSKLIGTVDGKPTEIQISTKDSSGGAATAFSTFIMFIDELKKSKKRSDIRSLDMLESDKKTRELIRFSELIASKDKHLGPLEYAREAEIISYIEYEYILSLLQEEKRTGGTITEKEARYISKDIYTKLMKFAEEVAGKSWEGMKQRYLVEKSHPFIIFIYAVRKAVCMRINTEYEKELLTLFRTLLSNSNMIQMYCKISIDKKSTQGDRYVLSGFHCECPPVFNGKIEIVDKGVTLGDKLAIKIHPELKFE